MAALPRERLRNIFRLIGRAASRRQRAKPKRITPPRHPKMIEASYARLLLAGVRRTREVTMAVLGDVLPRVLERAARGDQRRDTSSDDARAAMAIVRATTTDVSTDERLRRAVSDVGERVGEYQGSELQLQVKQALSVEVPISDPRFGERLRSWTTENVELIKSIPRDSLEQVERLVLSAVQSGTRWETLSEQISARFDVAESRAALIARDQVGKFYGSTARARQTEMGLTTYVWRTSLDERVRPEHAEREGRSYKWSDPPEDGPPGIPINCRCTAEPDLEALIQASTEE